MKSIWRFGLPAMIAATVVFSPVNAQYSASKPSLTVKDCNSWPMVLGAWGINAPGTCAFYNTENEKPGKKNLHVHSVKDGSENIYEDASSPSFTADGKYLLFKMPANEVIMYNVVTKKEQHVNNVENFELFGSGESEWILYKKEGNTVELKNLITGKEHHLDNIEKTHIAPGGKYLLLINNPKNIELFDMTNGKRSNVLEGNGETGTVKFDKDEKKIFFEKIIAGEKSIWQYVIADNQAQRLLDSKTAGISGEFIFDGLQNVIAKGESIVFGFSRKPAAQMKKTVKTSVNVYAYIDTTPYSEQRSTGAFGGGKTRFKGIFNINSGKVVYREPLHEIVSIVSTSDGYYGYVSPSFQLMHKTGQNNIYFISTVTGEKKEVGNLQIGDLNYDSSPNQKYFLLKNEREDRTTDLYSYEVTTGKIIDLTGNLPIPQLDNDFRLSWYKRKFKIQAWLTGTHFILINDNYDIWKIDASGKLPPVNLTNGFGRKNKIVFNISVSQFSGNKKLLLPTTKRLLLSAYNYNTCENDFFDLDITKTSDPVQLTHGKYLQEGVDINGFEDLRGGNYVAKAAKSNIYLVKRANASESPNFFTTTDFKKFKPISNIYPEKQFNWLTTELVHFISRDGSKLKGVLYKPQNFDPSKKYPVIFYFYINKSQDLHRYHEPKLSNAVINIPYYVSNDYLVFTPDIDVEYKGKAAEIALNSIMGAADRLAQLSFVDSTKMAIHGHSWGGYECNYMVAHTGRFAAAFSGAGGTDNIGAYGLPTHGGHPNWYLGYDNPGGTLTEKLNVFSASSPKILAANVTTPLLIMHNMGDDAVRFEHSEGFFFYLWKLGKKVWMLEYDGETHTIDQEDNKIDFTIRSKQFFDHYLKGAPAPVWMTRGLPFNQKGYKDGLELDTAIKTPQ